MQRRFLEIRSIGRKHLPARDLLSQHLNGPQIRKLAAQRRVVLFSGAEPHPVVGSRLALVAQYQNNFVLNINREAPEHEIGPGREFHKGVEHKFMRDSFALPGGE